MRKTILAAVAVLSLGTAMIAPAYAEGEGNGDPFRGTYFTLTASAGPVYTRGYAQRDVGSEQFPGTAGRPGTDLMGLANGTVLPAESNEATLQTANSLPRAFEDGTLAYAQAKSMNNWMAMHRASASNLASR